MKSLTSVACFLLAAFYLQACQATPPVPYENFNAESTPSGAIVRFSTGEKCVTPCSLERKANEAFSVTFSKEGYKSATVNVKTTTVETPTAGPVGAAISKRLWGETPRLEPNPVRAELEPSWQKR